MIRKFQDSIKLKLFLAMLLVLFLVVFFAFYSVRVIELDSADILQNKEAEQKADIVLNTLDAYNEPMQETVSSWGLSTNAYDYISGINPTFETNYLNIDTFRIVNIDLVIFYDESGDIYFERLFDFNTNQIVTPSQTLTDDISAIEVNENTANDYFVEGYIDVDGFVYYIVSAPITKIDGTDMVGNLIFGRLIDDKELDYIRSIVNYDFTVSESTIEDNQTQSIEYIDGNQMIIKREFDQMLSSDHLMIVIQMNTEILDVVQASIIRFSFAILILGFSFAIISGAIFNQIVFKRLRNLYDEINEISHFGNYSSRINHQQNHDEISVISREINFMLGKINEDERIIYELAYTDHLTHMPNRLQFIQMAESLVVESIVRREKFAILFMDLDNFKIVNDTYGHHIGDKLIIRFTQLLEQVCKNVSMISRIGGDEFLVLMTYKNNEELVELAISILDIFEQKIKVDELELTLSASIGIARYPIDSIEVEGVIAAADKAMYKAKNQGKNNYQFYDKDNNKTE